MSDKHLKDGEEPKSIDEMLSEQTRLESLIREKFNKVLTVMFTDLKGSTSLAETEGDLTTRRVIKEYNDIITSSVCDNNGVLVKFIGDGSLSYFEETQDALRAAKNIQQGIDAINLAGKYKTSVLVRIGIHRGPCLLENDDVFGDTVNTASRFESSANPGEILLSSEAYNALSDKSEIYCRFDRSITLRGKKEEHDAYRAFWNPEEIEQSKSNSSMEESLPKSTPWVKIFMFITILITIVLVFSLWNPMMKLLRSEPETRTLQYTLE